MANTFSVPQVSHHHLFIFPFSWNKSPVWHDVFSFLSALILLPITTKLVAPTPMYFRATARPGGGLDACKAGRERCSSFFSLHCPLFLLALRTCTLFRTYWSFAIPDRDEQEKQAANPHGQISRVCPCSSSVEPASFCAVFQGPPTPQRQPPRCNPNFFSSPSPEKAALPATWSCSSTSKISSSSMHSSNTSFSESL